MLWSPFLNTLDVEAVARQCHERRCCRSLSDCVCDRRRSCVTSGDATVTRARGDRATLHWLALSRSRAPPESHRERATHAHRSVDLTSNVVQHVRVTVIKTPRRSLDHTQC